jgi:alkanesulfonate monooxygenase SsuD/methylene tetrahydromethanopterin reductase-like flavin-dependent oxidoreductase (luciferase family)
MQFGIDSFAANFAGTDRNITGSDSLRQLIERIEYAEQVGLDVFGVGEHHRREFLDSAVRVFQNFATLDLLSQGRAEMVVGRGSFTESFPLFGLALKDYDSLFGEKLDLLLNIRENEFVHWSGKHRAALTGQGVYPRPLQNPIPIWLGVGGTPESFARAGALGLPLMIAIIGGETHRFRPLVDLYREMGKRAGHSPEQLKVGVHALGYVADTTKTASDEFFPGYARSFTDIGKERGWPPVTRAHFEAARSPRGALLVGGPEEVAKKILAHSESLGGIARISFQMDVAALPHAKLMHAIELLGTRVAPVLRETTALLNK